jgi:hypothetical protein
MRVPGYGIDWSVTSCMKRSLALLAIRFGTALLVLCLVVAPVCSSWCAARACSLPAPSHSSSTGCHHHRSISSPSTEISAYSTAGFCPAANDFPAALRPESATSISSSSFEHATDRVVPNHTSLSAWSSSGPRTPLQLSRGVLDSSFAVPLRL